MAEVFLDVGGRDLRVERVISRSVGTARRVPHHANERDLADARSGFGVAAGHGLVIQRFFRRAEIREGVDKPRRLLHVIEFIGGELIGGLALCGDFGKPLVVGEQEIMIFLASIHGAFGLDLGQVRLDQLVGVRSG